MNDFKKLINASDLIEWIMEAYPDWCVGAVRSIVDHVNDMPSAEAEPVKRGTWTWKHDRHKYVMGPVFWYECSNCEGIAYVEHPYCPHCGAKMEKSKELTF